MFPGSDTGLTCSEASPTRALYLVVKTLDRSDTGLTCSEASPTRRETEECFQGLIQG